MGSEDNSACVYSGQSGHSAHLPGALGNRITPADQLPVKSMHNNMSPLMRDPKQNELPQAPGPWVPELFYSGVAGSGHTTLKELFSNPIWLLISCAVSKSDLPSPVYQDNSNPTSITWIFRRIKQDLKLKAPAPTQAHSRLSEARIAFAFTLISPRQGRI